MSFIKCALVLCVAVAAHGFSLGPTDVVFHLYTRGNPTVSQPLLPSQASISTSTFQRASRTVITIHNYGDSASGNFNAFVVPAHLNTEDVNVIAVDWSPGASTYTFGLANMPQLGSVIADFVNILSNDFGYSPANIRLVGHGLGAHAAGIAARRITGNIPSIIALDPSLHGWTHHPDILNKDDAGIVEVIHTTAGLYGYDKPLGNLDFYPNGGVAMTGCGNQIACSHTMSYVYYAESVSSEGTSAPQFVGTACDSYESAIAMQCSGSRDVVFGGWAVKTASGVYSFFTNITPPFARG